MKDKLMTVGQLAELLHTSPSYISNQIHMSRQGITIPPSIKLGRKRLWLESVVQEWLLDKVAQSITESHTMNGLRGMANE